MFALTRHRGRSSGPGFPASRGAALLIGATAMAVLAGCGSSGSTTPSSSGGSSSSKRRRCPSAGTTVVAGGSCKSSSATKITFWAWVPGFGRAVNEFNKTHPSICVTLEDVGAGSPEYVKISDALKAGSGAPDVAEVEFDELPSFEITHNVVNLTKYGANNYKSDFVPWAWSEVSQGSGVYAMPSDSGPMGFYYNTKQLAKYHITPPATWAQFAADAAKLHKAELLGVPDQLRRHRPAVGPEPDVAGRRVPVHLHRRRQGRDQLDRPGPDEVRRLLAEDAVGARAQRGQRRRRAPRSRTWTRASTRAGSARPGARPTSRRTPSRRSATGGRPRCRSGRPAPTSRPTGAAPPTRCSRRAPTRRRRPSSRSG